MSSHAPSSHALPSLGIVRYFGADKEVVTKETFEVTKNTLFHSDSFNTRSSVDKVR